MQPDRSAELRALLNQRILILDGAMGTMIQRNRLAEADYRGERFAAHGTELKGKPVILLTTVGAKTGKLRKTPLMRVEHNGEYAVVASLGGAPRNPVWFHNITKHPRVELQDGTGTGERA